eukprot:6265299-Prymnesium_polylepis.1
MLHDRVGDRVGAQLLDQRGNRHEREGGDRLRRTRLGLRVHQRAIRTARAVDAGRVKECPATLDFWMTAIGRPSSRATPSWKLADLLTWLVCQKPGSRHGAIAAAAAAASGRCE